jgi:hypothetical protein
MSRPRHPDKELEAIIREAEDGGWLADRPSAYFRLLCPCGQHQRRVHITPSNPRYGLNLRMWLKRQPCWRGGTTR